jgi:DHA1 family bicyclomycin/chloramphenicol resistance-like MFS transporter
MRAQPADLRPELSTSPVTPVEASLGLVAILAAATALAPLAMQVFLPALPAIRAHYDVPAGVAQLAFSLAAALMAVATLLYGPMSDRYGRRPVLIAGLLVYLLGSLICLVAPSIELLIAGRVIQAVGGCAGMVLARAIIMDLFGRERSAQMLAYVTTAMVLAPMVSPAIGGVLTDLFGWRAIFVFGALFGAVVLAAILTRLAESNRARSGGISPVAMLAGFRSVLRRPAFRGYAAHGAFSLSLFFSFLAGAPFVTIEVMGRPATEYGIWFIVISACFMAGNMVAARVSARFGLDRMILVGTLCAVLGVTLAVLGMALVGWTMVALFLPMSLAAFGQGMAMPNAQAGAVGAAPDAAGAASGLAGFLQMAAAAAFAQAVGMIQNDTPYPMLAAMALCAVGALGACAMILRAARRPARPPAR